MFFRSDVIAWAFTWVFCVQLRLVLSAPTSASASDATSTSTSSRPRQTGNPYPYADSGDNSSPMTTIVIVCVVGSLALLGAAWGFYSCMVARRTPKIVSVAGGTNAEPTTLIYIPGEQPAMAALPALRYNAPSMVSQRDPEMADVGPGVILPPPPSYDVAMGGKPPQMTEGGDPFPYRLKRERTDSRWKDLLVSQGRD